MRSANVWDMTVGPIPVDLPSPPIVTDNAASSSTNMTTKSWVMVKDKGKGIADLEPEVDGSRKRKSPMISALPSQPPMSAMKGWKWVRSACIAKSRMVVESEDDEDPVIQPSGSRVPEVILPLLSTIDSRTPRSPHSPWSPKKQTFDPVLHTATSSSHLEVIEPPQAMSTIPVETPPVFDAGDILIPGPMRQSMLHMLAAPTSGPVQVAGTRGLVPSACHVFTAQQRRSNVPWQIWEPHQTIPSSSSAVPRAALDLPMLDLHAMALAIQNGAAQIAILEAHVVEQDGKIDTLQCLHESLRCEIIDWYPSFPLLDLSINATLLLDQSIPAAMSPLASALPVLIDLSMTGMEPTPPTFEDASSIEGLMFEPTQGQPEDPQTSGNMVDWGDPGNLVPEYNSDDMNVEVKVEEDIDIAT
ncbi:hypothetical protein BD769DRAFT_1662362 [Suillus cothurnatus]|nr:hypothetical protein BD769DRAFT_1662362 [Suillus cothurnatus]